MKKRLFLMGPDRSGKSKMIREALGDRIRDAGGFVTIRQRDEEGNVLGFELSAADGFGTRERFLDLTGKRPVSYPDVFSRMGIRLLEQAESRPFAVLDELGGVELLDGGFVKALVKLTKGDTPCVGVLRDGSAGKTVGLMGLDLRYELARRALYSHLMKDPDTIVVRTSGKHDPEARRMVEEWVRTYVNN